MATVIDMSHFQAIYAACKIGDLPALMVLLDNKQHEKSESVISHALYIAVQNQHIHIVQYIFNTFKVDMPFIHLYEACRIGNIVFVSYIMTKCTFHHINWNFMAESACKGGHTHVLDYINKKKPRGCELDRDLMFYTLCANGHLELIKTIININNTALVVNPRTYMSLNYYSALCIACENGHIEVAKFIIEQCKTTLTKCNIEDAILHAKLNQQFETADFMTQHMLNSSC